MAKSTTIHAELISKLLSGYMLNPKLTASCIDFIGKALIQNLSESELSMYLNLCIANISSKTEPLLVEKQDIVAISIEHMSSWKVKDLGDTDLMIDAGIIETIKGVKHYRGYVCGGASYTNDYSTHYPTKEIALFSINADSEIYTTKLDTTTDLLVKTDQYLSPKLKEYMLSLAG